MTYSREDALELILRLKTAYEDRKEIIHLSNEATTRLLLIDKVLEILGWEKEDFRPETHVTEKGFIDYLLSIEGVPRLVVEAKRTGKTFGTTARQSSRDHYQLRYFRSAFGKSFSQVVEQAEKYVQETGVKYALITNGCEWILLQLLPAPGYADINDLTGYYFGNLFRDNFNFEAFWEILYKPYVDSGSLESAFAELNVDEADFVAVPAIKIGQSYWQMERANDVLRDFYDYFFDEIVDPGRRNMLEKCFVTDARLNQFQGQLNRALRDTAPAFVPEAVDIEPGDNERLIPQNSGDQKGRVVIVTGSVGCGKSTFVTRELVRVRRDQKGSVLALDVNLIDEVENEHTDVQALLWRYIVQQWQNAAQEAYQYDTLRKIFGRELAGLHQGPYKQLFEQDKLEAARQEAALLENLVNDPHVYFRRCWHYYRSRGTGIVVFLDNVDRASESFQRQVYSFTHKLARETGATVIVTMRELTFFRGREAGFLDVRSDATVFHLKAPNLEQLISKRVAYIEQHVQNDHRLSDWKRTRDWDRFYEEILLHAGVLKAVFLTGNGGRDLLALLGSVAWHNVRLFLNTLKQIHFLLGSGQGNWNKSQVIAALVAPVDRERPILGNLYRPAYPAHHNYFLKFRVLLLMLHGQVQYETRHGTSLESIMRFLRQYGYLRRWIRRSVQELVQQRFLECLEAPAAEEYTKHYQIGDRHSFRPSPLAYVCVDSIVTDPNYLALIGNDLPFHQESSLRQYEKIITEFAEALSGEGLSSAAIELLSETNASVVVARYLVERLEEEQVSRGLARYKPEVAGAERKLAEIGNLLRQRSQLEDTRVTPDQQPSLFDVDVIPAEFQDEGSSDRSRLPIPKNITDAKIGKSELAPLIYWALVHLRLAGNLSASGVQITDVVNEYLVDEDSQKAPNNISRTLRSPLMLSQDWLVMRKISAKRKVFHVKPNWKEYWQVIFGESAPDLENL